MLSLHVYRNTKKSKSNKAFRIRLQTVADVIYTRAKTRLYRTHLCGGTYCNTTMTSTTTYQNKDYRHGKPQNEQLAHKFPFRSMEKFTTKRLRGLDLVVVIAFPFRASYQVCIHGSPLHSHTWIILRVISFNNLGSSRWLAVNSISDILFLSDGALTSADGKADQISALCRSSC